MIKYETINGTLCRMVEPEPLYQTMQDVVAWMKLN